MAYGDQPAPHQATHAPGAADALTGYVDTTTAQNVAGTKTFANVNQNGQWTSAGMVRYTPTSRTGAVTLTTSSVYDNLCDASTGAFTVTLPATTVAGYRFLITKADSSANAVAVSASVSIAGVTTALKLQRQGDSVEVRSTGTSGVWLISGGTFNPVKPGIEPLYTNLTIPTGNTVSATGNGTANQQVAFTTGPTIGANYFYPGMKVQLKGWGYYTATAAVNVQPEVWAGGVTGVKLIDAGALGLPSTQANCRYDFEIWLKCRTAGTSGVLECYGRLIFMNPTANAAGALTFPVGTNGSANAVGSTTVTYDTTVSRLVQLSAAYSSATSGDTNTLVSIEAVGYPPGAASS